MIAQNTLNAERPLSRAEAIEFGAATDLMENPETREQIQKAGIPFDVAITYPCEGGCPTSVIIDAFAEGWAKFHSLPAFYFLVSPDDVEQSPFVLKCVKQKDDSGETVLTIMTPEEHP